MTGRQATAGGGLLLAAVAVFALNLRGPIVAPAPVVGEIAADLGLGAATVGLLTGLPVLCFAAFTPTASWLIARLGVERAVTISMVAIVAGIAVRSAAGFPAAVAGTVVLGSAIALGNICLPVLARRDFPRTMATVTGIYMAAMNLGSVATTAGTAPIAALVGWRWALAVWALPVVVALGLWWVAVRRRDVPVTNSEPPATRSRPPAGDAAPDPRPTVLRRPMTWVLVAMFTGQSFSYYAVTAWLPSVLQDDAGLVGNAPGSAASLFQLFAIAGSLAVPAVLARGASVRIVFVVMVTLWLMLPAGMLLVPGGWGFWAAAGGVAQGGTITVIFTVVLLRSRGVDDARRTSTAVQTVGYAVAAAGPSLLGALHTASASWALPMATILAAMLLTLVAGIVATRPRGLRP